MTQNVIDKLGRLAHIFDAPHLIEQFKDHWHHAYLLYRDSNYTLSYWRAWLGAVAARSVCQSHDLSYVCKRGEAFAPCTSDIEKSFSLLDERYDSHRHTAPAHQEDQSINLLLSKYSDAGLDDLIKRATQIWRESFRRHARTSK